MIKGNVGKVTINEDNGLIADEKFFVETFALEDGLKNLKAGTLLKWNTDKTKLSLLGAHTEEPIAVLYENVEGSTKGSHALALIFGRVNVNALVSAGTSVAELAPADKRNIIESLRKVGIYATEGER